MQIEAKRPVKTVETAFELLEIIKQNNGATLAEVVDEHEIAKSTAHRHLQTLVDIGFVVKKDGNYKIGLKFLEYGIHTRKNKCYRSAKAKTIELAEKTAERVQFIVEENDQGNFVYRKTGENAVHTDPGIGKPCPLHATAAGKAILSQLPEERIREGCRPAMFELLEHLSRKIGVIGATEFASSQIHGRCHFGLGN